MRTFALALSLLSLTACKSFGWEGQGGDLTEDQRARGIQDVSALADNYESQSFFREMGRRIDGRSNAFGRDLMTIQDFIDRNFWNYNANDPAVNYPTDTTMLEHLGRFSLVTVTSIPPMDEITQR
jgi:hypothetical protein